MNEIDILKKLASNLTEKKSVAALNNYEVLCNNIEFSHDLLEKGINYLAFISNEIKNTLDDNNLLNDDYKNGQDLNSFALIIPSLIFNDLEVIKKLSLFTLPDNRTDITTDNVNKLHRGFVDYNNLVTATRQFIDSLITDSYQLQILTPKEFNYHVLLSLNSFEKYATKSIRHGLFNDEIESALTEFRTLSFNNWKNSSITKCQHLTFANKVDYLFTQLNKTSDSDNKFKDEIKNIFKFSSEFTHVGYISTFFTSKSGSQPIFGSDKGPYLPSTENFSELKYQILESCINFIYQIYLPSINSSIEKIVSETKKLSIQNHIKNLIHLLSTGIETRNNNYYFFICASLMNDNKIIELPCSCGYKNSWKLPYKKSDLFCIGCGSSFNLIALDGDPGYIFTSNGPVKVIGSSVPEFEDLNKNEKIKLLTQMEEQIQKTNKSEEE